MKFFAVYPVLLIVQQLYYSPFLSKPSSSAPGFLYTVSTSPPSPIPSGPLSFILDFSAPMTTSIQPTVTLSLSFDHRIIDGAPAAQFLQKIKNFLENHVNLCARRQNKNEETQYSLDVINVCLPHIWEFKNCNPFAHIKFKNCKISTIFTSLNKSYVFENCQLFQT